jgi:flagellar protein FlaJ
MFARPDVVPFVPRQKFRVDWAGIVILAAAALGVLIALVAGLTLAGRVQSLGPLALRPTHGIDLFAIAFLVGSGPYAFVAWRRRLRRQRIDARLPDFLTDLASLHKAGLTLPDSVATAAEGDYGPLSVEVRWAAEQIAWDIPVLLVLENLKGRIGTNLAERTLTVVIEAGKTGGNVPEVLEIAAGNARATVQMAQTRASSMGLYTVITYVASMVFVGVALALQGIFVPKMIQAFNGIGGGGGALGFSRLPTSDQFRGLFLSAALVQSFGNGLVGGVISEGRPTAGLRHAWLMVLFSLIGFQLMG